MEGEKSALEAVIKIGKCVFCSSKSLHSLLKIDKVPGSSQVLYKKQSDAVNCITRSLHIFMCKKCAAIFNGSYCFKQKTVDQYKDPDYYSSMSFSSQSRKYQKELASKVNNLLNLQNKTICEIGCGDGFFLNEISKYSRDSIGFEPSSTFDLAKKYQNIKIYNNYFNPHQPKMLRGKKINLFILRHVLEHLSNPFQYLKLLKECYRVPEAEQGLLLEVPNAIYLMKNNFYFDFYYDHVYYFTPVFLVKFLKRLGWKKITLIESGQKEFLRVFCSNKDAVKTEKLNKKVMLSYSCCATSFSKNYNIWKKQIIKQLEDLKKSRKKIGVWGAGSRGVTLINSIGRDNKFFSYAIDSDTNKQQRFIPVLGIPIVSVKILEKEPVDYLLITAQTYFYEIAKSLEKYTRRGLKLIKVYPKIEIFTNYA